MSDLQIVRYPSGAKEFRMSGTAPAVGDVVRRNGDDCVVEAVQQADDGSTVVTLRSRPLVEPDTR